MNNDNKTNSNTTDNAVSYDPSPNPEFLREKIKQKPINKKKLLRRSILTVATAAVFGSVACLTFLLLEPLISSKINKSDEIDASQEVSTIEFADTENEISPEDMYATDTEMIAEALQGNTTEVNQNIKNIETMISEIQFGIDDYRMLYNEMRDLSIQVSNSIVTVTGYTSNSTPLDSMYSDNSQVSGVIVANNGPSLLVLVKNNGLLSTDLMQITFYDGTSSSCNIVGYDEATDLLILSVNCSNLKPSTLEAAVPIALGTSRSTTLKGSPIMALGSPNGTKDSLLYGIITSNTKQIDLTDSDYTIISTDMIGSENSSGILVNLRGYVVGIIDTTYSDTSSTCLINAIGITELKPLIEKISNKEAKAYLGIHGTDITKELQEAYNLPDGIYLSSIEIDSPAMSAGLQNGDILVSVNGETPGNYHDFISWINGAAPGDTVNISVRRQSINDYVPLAITVTLGSLDYTLEE